MQVLPTRPTVPVYCLRPDGVSGNKHFRVYTYEGGMPDHADLLIPHRKDHYLLVFIRRGGGTRQWIDMNPYVLKDNTFYFTGPNQLIVKEEFKQLWSTGIAFTQEFLSLQENDSLSRLPILQNPHNAHELLLTENDVLFVEDLIQKVRVEYERPGEWQQGMLAAYLNALLIHMSRLYREQYKDGEVSADGQLFKDFLARVEEGYQQFHEVGDYASMLHISAGHLSDVVKNQTGKPAIKHIHDRIALEARRLLVHTNNPLKDIAFDLGFTDASYFNRFFKRETGVTPASYRAQIREMYH